MFLLEPLCRRGCNQTLKHLRGFFCFWLVYWKIRHSHTSNHRQNVRLMMRQAVNSLVCTNYLFADGNLNICRSNWMALEHYQTYSLSSSEMYVTNNTFTMVFLKVSLTKNVLKYLENSFYLFLHGPLWHTLLWSYEWATIKLISRAKRDYFSYMMELIVMWTLSIHWHMIVKL